jgi:integrase
MDVTKVSCRGVRQEREVAVVFANTKELLNSRRGRQFSAQIQMGSPVRCSALDLPLWMGRLERAATELGLSPTRDSFICERNGTAMKATAVSTVLRRHLRNAGIEATPHAFRATFASLAIDLGFEMDVVQHVGRWSATKSLRRCYSKFGSVSRLPDNVRLPYPRDDFRSFAAQLACLSRE